MKKTTAFRVIFYVSGLLILALGIILNTKSFKKNVQRYGCLLLCIFLLCTLLPVSAAVEEANSESIRVGWYEDSYNTTGKNGELDLMSGVSYTEERAQSMLFSELPMGEERYYLYADLTNTDISAQSIK